MQELNDIISFLEKIMKEYDFEEDNKKIELFFQKINDIKNKIPTKEELEEIERLEVELETRYDILNELSNYFDPIHVKIKRMIHDEYVKKLRETNRKKKGNY